VDKHLASSSSAVASECTGRALNDAIVKTPIRQEWGFIKINLFSFFKQVGLLLLYIEFFLFIVFLALID
jgi:hypothetical protein